MLTGLHIKAARAVLGWSVKELAERSGVKYGTIRSIEDQPGVPNTSAQYLAALEVTFRDLGIDFGAGDRDSISWLPAKLDPN